MLDSLGQGFERQMMPLEQGFERLQKSYNSSSEWKSYIIITQGIHKQVKKIDDVVPVWVQLWLGTYPWRLGCFSRLPTCWLGSLQVNLSGLPKLSNQYSITAARFLGGVGGATMYLNANIKKRWYFLLQIISKLPKDLFDACSKLLFE